MDRYEEALEKAREQGYTWLMDLLEGMFPDLKEDEDERVRQMIENTLRDAVISERISETSYREMLAYLEKQKKEEQPTNEEMLRTLRTEYEKGVADTIAKYEQKERKPPITGNDFGWIDELKHDLKHPEELDQKVNDVLKQRKGIRTLEWSEEDEKMYARVVRRYTDYEGVIMRIKEESVANKMLNAMAQEEIWLKSLIERFNLQQDQESVAERFARIVRGNLIGIDKEVQHKFEQLYFEVTGNKMYGGFND